MLLWIRWELRLMLPRFRHLPSHRFILLRIVPINGIVVMRAFMLVRTRLASVPNRHIIPTVAAHVPVVVPFDGIRSIP